MSALLEAPPEASPAVAPAVASRRWWRRPLAACALLLVVYVGLSFLNDPRGYLGTDTGGKVATLQVMKERGRFDPDIGYWAERWDPDGSLHPLYYTTHVGSRWVNVTTLPALAAAYPLYRIGGYRLALLVPMLGSVLAALAARALLRRIRDGSDGWAAFWLVGLASPLAVYALDFWEHSLGVAAMAWAMVLLHDLMHGRRRAGAAAGAGLLLGLSATMRTETFVYAGVAGLAVATGLLVRRRPVRDLALFGVVGGAAAAAVLVANQAFEKAVLGQAIRSGRAAGTVAGTGADAHLRAREALVTATGLRPAVDLGGCVLGIGLLVLLVVAVRRSRAAEPVIAVGAAIGAALLYVMRFGEGSGFVPGLVAATPIAAVALAWGWRDTRARFPLVIAVGALPLVWATQFTGGAAPQWAGRYILVSGFLLAVVGVASLDRLARWCRVGVVVLSVAVTAFGVSWLSVRSHDVGRAEAALTHLPEPVVVSQVAHLAREGGPATVDRHWLTALGRPELERAAGVARASGASRFAYVQLEDIPPPAPLTGYEVVGTRKIRLFDGVDLRITSFAAAP